MSCSIPKFKSLYTPAYVGCGSKLWFKMLTRQRRSRANALYTLDIDCRTPAEMAFALLQPKASLIERRAWMKTHKHVAANH